MVKRPARGIERGDKSRRRAAVGVHAHLRAFQPHCGRNVLIQPEKTVIIAVPDRLNSRVGQPLIRRVDVVGHRRVQRRAHAAPYDSAEICGVDGILPRRQHIAAGFADSVFIVKSRSRHVSAVKRVCDVGIR